MKASPKSLLLLPVLAVLLGLPALSGEPKPYALLAGTVFSPEGLSLPGVRVTIKRKQDRKPKWDAVSDRRGEFAVRLPAGRDTYEVTTHSKDFTNQTKSVELAGSERVDLILRLSPKPAERRDD